MKLRFKILSVVLALTLLFSVIFFGLSIFPPIERDYMKMGRIMLAQIAVAEEAYFKVHNHYSSNLEEIGIKINGKPSYQFYLTEESVPEELRAKLREDQKPFLGERGVQAYRIIAIDGKSILVKGNDTPLLVERL